MNSISELPLDGTEANAISAFPEASWAIDMKSPSSRSALQPVPCVQMAPDLMLLAAVSGAVNTRR